MISKHLVDEFEQSIAPADSPLTIFFSDWLLAVFENAPFKELDKVTQLW